MNYRTLHGKQPVVVSSIRPQMKPLFANSETSLYLEARYKSPHGLKLLVNHCKQRLNKATNLFEAAVRPFSKGACFQCRHSKWDTQKKIVQSQRFLTTKDSQVFCKQTNKNKH